MSTDTTTTAFTPGPWKIIHGGFRNDDGFSIGSDNAAASRVKVTCECWPCTIVDQEHRDELRANARLIAAAPNLIRALAELVDSEPCRYDHNEFCQEHYCSKPCKHETAKQVIAKAVGEVEFCQQAK